MKKYLISILLISVLSGCAIFDQKKELEVIVDNKTKKEYSLPSKIDRDLCIDLPNIKDGTFGGLAKYIGKEVPPVYYECARKHKELSDWLDRFEKDTTK